MRNFQAKYTGFVYGEGRTDKDFLIKLIDLEKFRYHTQKWQPFNYGSYHGTNPAEILENCKKAISNKSYAEISIMWHQDNLEDELRSVLGGEKISKNALNKTAKAQPEKFINSAYWHRIIDCIKNREKELDAQ